MELHHKLRRDPSWHPSACNICGQMGHQAAQCTTGTINWRQMYGDVAFRIQPTVFQSDIDAIKKAREVDHAKLAEVAAAWARKRQEELENPQPEPAQQAPSVAGGAAGEPSEVFPPTGGPDAAARPGPAAAAQAVAPAVAIPPPAGPPPAADPTQGLPEGWGATRDGSGKVYYWHKVTKKVQWDRPTPDTPIS
ncbi:hypothetical protein ACKKBG_A09535 [Auxenochlorella protothecoides x Auxenochlorella symbiontica]